MFKPRFLLLIATLCVPALAACSFPHASSATPSAPEASPPTARSSPPAPATPTPSTPAPSLATPSPQVAAGSPRSGATIAPTILAGMRRTRPAPAFRLHEETIAKGGLENVLLFLGLSDPQQVGLLHSWALECNGPDCFSILKGGSAAMLGADREGGIQSLTASGDGYIHGPLAIPELAEDRWYRQPGQPSPFAIPVLSGTELFGYVDDYSQRIQRFKLAPKPKRTPTAPSSAFLAIDL